MKQTMLADRSENNAINNVSIEKKKKANKQTSSRINDPHGDPSVFPFQVNLARLANALTLYLIFKFSPKLAGWRGVSPAISAEIGPCTAPSLVKIMFASIIGRAKHHAAVRGAVEIIYRVVRPLFEFVVHQRA